MLCAAATDAQQPDRPPEPSPIELPADLDAVLRAYETAWARGDAGALSSLFSVEGFVLRPQQAPITGRSAIERAYSNAGGPLRLQAYDYAMEGTVAWVVGGYGYDESGPNMGKFVLALERGPEGRWLIAADIDNGNGNGVGPSP